MTSLLDKTIDHGCLPFIIRDAFKPDKMVDYGCLPFTKRDAFKANTRNSSILLGCLNKLQYL